MSDIPLSNVFVILFPLFVRAMFNYLSNLLLQANFSFGNTLTVFYVVQTNSAPEHHTENESDVTRYVHARTADHMI